ncbi:hypothetical protein DFH08DRAFT_826003 [Mycena albidolilacea]|uniref:Uncharacterized protein n=1 Tax=Mycena albidolilacea TaxID=1033008 RepID=A0AAD6Z1P3_9AGAR|nr:hypothetical protein DFH08DRAFT_826003 [Mycena albidolilacea]
MFSTRFIAVVLASTAFLANAAPPVETPAPKALASTDVPVNVTSVASPDLDGDYVTVCTQNNHLGTCDRVPFLENGCTYLPSHQRGAVRSVSVPKGWVCDFFGSSGTENCAEETNWHTTIVAPGTPNMGNHLFGDGAYNVNSSITVRGSNRDWITRMRKQICVTKDKMVIITMPGPQKHAGDAPVQSFSWMHSFWPTNDDSDDSSGAGGSAGPSKTAHGAKQEFDFAELEATSTEESVAEQKLSFDKAVAPHVEELKERWPENDAGKRIYPDDKGPRNHNEGQSSTLDLQCQYHPHHPSHHAPAPMQPFAPALAPMQPFTPAPAPMPAVLPPAEPSPVQSAPSSPAKEFHRAVSLEEFCTHYDIMQHYDRLQKLEYEPGDKGIFWGSTDNFLKDAQAGLWA